jgi:hypothetical protein
VKRERKRRKRKKLFELFEFDFGSALIFQYPQPLMEAKNC